MKENAPVMERRNRRVATILAAVACLMFGFGFAMVPLYSLLCEATGLQSISVRTRADDVTRTVTNADPARELVVKFNAVVQPELPWDFYPEQNRIEVHPGQTYTVNFVAANQSDTSITAQAIPSIAPWQATPYFHKVECFCFSRQTLDGGKSVKMPLRFIVSADMPADISSLTLSYSFLRVQQDDSVLAYAGATDKN